MTNPGTDTGRHGGAKPSMRDMANAIRALAMDAVEAAKSGHPGMPMGMADVATVLFTKFLKFDAGAPDWPDRDRFVLSAGHGSMLLYSLLHLTGYADVTLERPEELPAARQPGPPAIPNTVTPGIETTTGPLGQGLATAVGMAHRRADAGGALRRSPVDHYTYVIAGDGCLMEGISHEAIDLAGHLRLNQLIVLWDDNCISIDGATAFPTSMDQMMRFDGRRLGRVPVDGHDPAEIDGAIAEAQTSTGRR